MLLWQPCETGGVHLKPETNMQTCRNADMQIPEAGENVAMCLRMYIHMYVGTAACD